jgi:hypothetical protein
MEIGKKTIVEWMEMIGEVKEPVWRLFDKTPN